MRAIGGGIRTTGKRLHGASVRAARKSSALCVLPGAVDWSLLVSYSSTKAAPFAALSTVAARRGTSPTSSGASRPAFSSSGFVFGGTQQLDAAIGLLGGSATASVLVVMQTSTTSGVIYCYSNDSLYYNGRKALMSVPSAAHVSAANGESAVGNRNYAFAPVGTGLRTFAAVFDRAKIGSAEFAIYDNGTYAPPDATLVNDTAGTYLVDQKSTIGAYVNGLLGLVASIRAFGLTTTALTADQVRRLSMLLNAACGVS